MKSAFDKIAAGLEDAIAYAQGDISRGREVRPVDLKAIRRSINLTQNEFAKAYQLPLGTVRDWEQNRTQPDSGSRVYLRMIAADPTAVRKLVGKMAA